jgi:hypothetical protein
MDSQAGGWRCHPYVHREWGRVTRANRAGRGSAVLNRVHQDALAAELMVWSVACYCSGARTHECA